MAIKKKKSSVMEELITDSYQLTFPKPGTLVDGNIITILKNKILVDLDGFSTGVISGQETHDSTGTMKSLKVGDEISAYVLEEENEDGLIVLSLRKASQKKTWNQFIEAYETSKVITIHCNEANKGGLLLNIDGIKGFLPVSQLAPLHYPRVDGADSNQILTRLTKLTNIPLKVKIINMDRDGGKLIFSERAAEEVSRQGSLDKLNVGQKVKGKISGIVKFGIFVTFEGLEGLVHISEIAWGHVKDPNDYGRLGDEVDVLVIGKEGDKISLSMKRLVPDPWIEASKKYKVGTLIEGEVNRITPFGAFVKLDDEINGLIHVSEITTEEVSDPGQFIKVGEKVKAKIIAIDPEEHRVALSLKSLSDKKSDKKEKDSDEDEDKEAKKAKKSKKEDKEEKDSDEDEKETKKKSKKKE